MLDLYLVGLHWLLIFDKVSQPSTIIFEMKKNADGFPRRKLSDLGVLTRQLDH